MKLIAVENDIVQSINVTTGSQNKFNIKSEINPRNPQVNPLRKTHPVKWQRAVTFGLKFNSFKWNILCVENLIKLRKKFLLIIKCEREKESFVFYCIFGLT